MKPHVKNDSWCYTASKKSARKKVKRLHAKRHRRHYRNITQQEMAIRHDS